jgi:hypothetical protein
MLDEEQRIVARVAVFVFAERSDRLRAGLGDIQEEARGWEVLNNPRAWWDADMERLVLEVDVTLEDRDAFGLNGYAEFVADQACKITCAALPIDIGNGGIRVLSIRPA